jgi:thiamine biosynthesis lipoprotein
LVRLWGFDREENLAVALDRPPAAELQALRAHQGTLADLTLTGNTLRSRRPLCIDLGGMAKGSALERARQVLAARGIAYALVDIGGSSLLALGPPTGMPSARPWRVGLQDPRGTGVLGTLQLSPGETVDTSGDYERSFSAGGQRYHHILDPRTGEPASGVASVTVISRDGELGDVASTALLAGGLPGWEDRARALGVSEVLLITGDGQVLTTPSMRERLLRSNGGKLPRVAWAPPGS